MAKLTLREIYNVARAAGFSPEQAVTFAAIAQAESGGNPNAHNPRGEDSRGLWGRHGRSGPRPGPTRRARLSGAIFTIR